MLSCAIQPGEPSNVLFEWSILLGNLSYWLFLHNTTNMKKNLIYCLCKISGLHNEIHKCKNNSDLATNVWNIRVYCVSEISEEHNVLLQNI